MWEITEVEHDPDLYLKAYGWYEQMPGFLRALQGLKGVCSKESFLEDFDGGTIFRGSVDGEPKVLVHAEHRGLSSEGHLLCSPDAGVDLCVATVSYARTQVLRTQVNVVCHVAKRHRTLIEIVERAGFRDSGMRSWQGVYRGRPQTILFYVAEQRHEAKTEVDSKFVDHEHDGDLDADGHGGHTGLPPRHPEHAQHSGPDDRVPGRVGPQTGRPVVG